MGQTDVLQEYSGLRRISCRNEQLPARHRSKVSRASEIEVTGLLVATYGGKWTLAPALAEKVVKKVRGLRIIC